MKTQKYFADCAGTDINDVGTPVVAAESRVSIRVVQRLREMLDQSGVPWHVIVEVTGLDLERAAHDILPRSMLYRICELAIERTNNPALGLHWARQLNPIALSPVSYIVAHAPTLRHSLDALSQLHTLFSEQVSFRIVERDDSVTLQCYRLDGASPAVQRFVAETMVAGIRRLILFFDARAKMRKVSFEHGAPRSRDAYDQLFLEPVSFDQPFSGLVFDRSLLRTTSPHKDAEIFAALTTVAKQRILRKSSRERISDRVHGLLVQRATFGSLRMCDAAQACGMSLRTLRRRLAAEGKSYQEVLNEALGVVARELLTDERRSIAEVSVMLGFDEAASFTRAFKRWTGVTPKSFRAQSSALGRTARVTHRSAQ